jgi:AcrR family transcriptional regulator
MAVEGRGGAHDRRGQRSIAIYTRLPHGPHRLDRAEVLRHQRLRIHGALVEAVAANGYERTSVKQVIGLAGVSRRSFYEHFTSKEQCLLATFDMLADRGVRLAGQAYLASDGALEDRLRAALGEFADALTRKRKAAGLVIVETQTVGPAGLMRLRRATARCEKMLCRTFVDAPETVALPVPVIRGITGGLHGAMSMCLREQQGRQAAELTEEMLAWTLLFQTPGAAGMAEIIAVRARMIMRGVAAKPRVRHEPTALEQDDRERLMQSTLRLATIEDFRELTAPRIAEQAEVSVDAFFELFADKDECFLAALEMLAAELLLLVADPALGSPDWPRAVRRVIGELMLYLADRPHYARTIAAEALTAGPIAVKRNIEIASGVAKLLTRGAPKQGASRLTVEGVAGAIWHTVRCQVASGRIQMLPVLSDYLSYVVLAPLIGAEAAVEVLSDDRTV